MKVVYYTDQIYLHGGLERVIANKLNYFNTLEGIDLHVITFQQNDKMPCYSIPETVHMHDIAINYNRNKSFLHPSNIKYAIKHYSSLKKIIKEIKPDVIVICNYEYGFYFIPFLAKKIIKVKEYHSSRHFYYLERQVNKNVIKNIVYKLTDYFESKYNYLVVLTKDELAYYKSYNKIIIPNSLNIATEKTATLTNKKVISAGRIAPVKRFEMLIESWKKVSLIYPDWILEIYGTGESEYVKSLNNQIVSLKLDKQVFIKGATQMLEEKMLESSIYVMTSLTECFPMVVLEAMSYGLPVVSFDCPNGPRNIINNGIDGILVENNNLEDLSNAIISLIKNRDKRLLLGYTAKKNVKRFSERNIMPLWLNIFGYNINK